VRRRAAQRRVWPDASARTSRTRFTATRARRRIRPDDRPASQAAAVAPRRSVSLCLCG